MSQYTVRVHQTWRYQRYNDLNSRSSSNILLATTVLIDFYETIKGEKSRRTVKKKQNLIHHCHLHIVVLTFFTQQSIV